MDRCGGRPQCFFLRWIGSLYIVEPHNGMGKPAAMDGWIIMTVKPSVQVGSSCGFGDLDRSCTEVLLLADTNQQKSNLEIMHDLDPAARSAGRCWKLWGGSWGRSEWIPAIFTLKIPRFWEKNGRTLGIKLGFTEWNQSGDFGWSGLAPESDTVCQECPG